MENKIKSETIEEVLLKTSLIINHDEALELSHFKIKESNLARCYLELNEMVDLMLADLDGKICPFNSIECMTFKDCKDCLIKYYRNKARKTGN